MPIADFTAASLREDSAPQEVPHKQKYHNLGFSSVIVADVTNVGDPRLVKPVHIAHAALSIGLLGFSFFLKRGGPTWETHDWLVVPYNASYTLNGLSLPPRLLCCVFVSCLWRGSFVSVFGGSRLERCQSTSRHGTCCCYAQSSR